jgi:hypothetical protein
MDLGARNHGVAAETEKVREGERGGAENIPYKDKCGKNYVLLFNHFTGSASR